MSEEPNGNRSDGPGRRDRGPQFKWRGFMLFLVALTLLGATYFAPFPQPKPTTLNYPTFKTMVEKDNVVSDDNSPLRLVRSDTTREEYIQGNLKKWDELLEEPLGEKAGFPPSTRAATPPSGQVPFKVMVNVEFQKEELSKLLTDHKLAITYARD